MMNEQTQPIDDGATPTMTETLTASAPTASSMGWPMVKPGMVVRVHQTIKDVNAKGEEKERTQIFEGLVLKRHGGNTAGATITVRKNSFGIWVEKIFPVHLPELTQIEIIKQFKTRRANLGFLRTNPGKRLKEKKK